MNEDLPKGQFFASRNHQSMNTSRVYKNKSIRIKPKETPLDARSLVDGPFLHTIKNSPQKRKLRALEKKYVSLPKGSYSNGTLMR